MITCKNCLYANATGKCYKRTRELCPDYIPDDGISPVPRYVNIVKSPSALAELLVDRNYRGRWEFRISGKCFETREEALAYAVKWLLEDDEVEK